MKLYQPFIALSDWFAQNDVPVDGVTVVLNFSNAAAAIAFQSAADHEIHLSGVVHEPRFFDRKIRMAGFDVMIESPAHDH